jgi:uncharacterized protein (TIGR00304 family)
LIIEDVTAQMNEQLVFSIGTILFFIGFAITFIAVILMTSTAMRGKAKVRGGGAVIIGPFPIIYGTDKESVKVLLLLSIALIALVLIAIVFSRYAFG